MGYIGFHCSYRGKLFGGYNGDHTGTRDYQDEFRRNTLKQIDNLVGVEYTKISYLDMVIPDGSLVYCDPPYENTTAYKYNIDHEIFWQWCRDLSLRNTVYISSYDAPKDFYCLWQKEVNVALDTHSTKKRTEKLYRWLAI